MSRDPRHAASRPAGFEPEVSRAGRSGRDRIARSRCGGRREVLALALVLPSVVLAQAATYALEAGTVKVVPPATVPEHTEVRVQGLNGSLADGNTQSLLWRRADLSTARAGLQIPAGSVHIGLWDSTAGEYVAHSRAIADPELVVFAQLKPPAAGRSDLIVSLRRPQQAPRAFDGDVELTVRTKEDDWFAIFPDAYGRGNDSVIAVWYGLRPGIVELEVSSTKVQLPKTYIDLRRDRIEYLDSQFLEAPKLRISLEVPPALDGIDRVVSVAWVGAKGLVRETLTGFKSEPVVQVPPTIVHVTAEVGPWKLSRRVDLRDGADAEVVLREECVLVSGRVLRGEHLESNATLTFGHLDETGIVGHSLDDGSYSALLPRAGSWPIAVRLAGRATSAEVVIEVDEGDPKSIDIVLSDNEWIVAVVDATTGGPVAGATVAVDNVASADGLRTRIRGQTDQAGEALLHPLRPGKAELVASAIGYREQPARLEEVSEAPDYQRFVVELEPEQERVALSIVLADGSPAAGAAVACVRSNGSLSLERVADPEGNLTLEPSTTGAECLLLVRHPDAAPWAGFRRGGPATIPLRASGAALNLLVSSGNGDPLPWAGLFVWIEGHRLGGQALGFFAAQRSDRDLLWTLSTTPAEDLRILAVSPALWHAAQSGALDSQSQLIRPAGPSLVVVEAVR